MANPNVRVLELFLIASLLTFNVTRQLKMKVSYELVEDFKQSTDDKLGRSHEIIRRDAGQGNSNISTTGLINPSVTISQPKITSQITPQSVVLPVTPASNSNISRASLSPSASSIEMVPTAIKVSLPTSAENTTQKTSETPFRSPETKPTVPLDRPEITTEPTKIDSKEDDHRYYKSQYHRSGQKWWFNLEGDKSIKLHEELSKNIKYADSLRSSFKFPYYGHLIDNVTITNKGYVFLGETVHKFNASAQYVAPLMADFGADLHGKTMIRYVDTGDRFTVEWANMKVLRQQVGEFSFQCSILKNGTLIFAYKKALYGSSKPGKQTPPFWYTTELIPVSVSQLKDDTFPVRIGLSDTYRRDRFGASTVNNRYHSKVHIITYYLYHKVKLPKETVLPGSAYVITPEPNCVFFNSCDSCVNTKTAFSCLWCPKLKRCSDGIDRYRQEWIMAGCLKDSTTTCSKKQGQSQGSHINAGEVFLIVLAFGIVAVLICWLVYAYRHPQSKSGMCLIEPEGTPIKRLVSPTNANATGGKLALKDDE